MSLSAIQGFQRHMLIHVLRTITFFFLTNPFLSNVTKFAFFTEPYLKQAVCQTVFEQSSCNGTLQKHIFASDRDTLTP